MGLRRHHWAKGISFAEAFILIEKPPGRCWIWPGAVNSKGRATFCGLSAPRLAYELVTGKTLPDGVGACHSCDNPRCVNAVDHIWPGTQFDNMTDCRNKGRFIQNHQPSGELHSMAKLTKGEVVWIRERVAAGEKQVDIAALVDISIAQVSRIVSGQRWRS